MTQILETCIITFRRHLSLNAKVHLVEGMFGEGGEGVTGDPHPHPHPHPHPYPHPHPHPHLHHHPHPHPHFIFDCFWLN